MAKTLSSGEQHSAGLPLVNGKSQTTTITIREKIGRQWYFVATNCDEDGNGKALISEYSISSSKAGAQCARRAALVLHRPRPRMPQFTRCSETVRSTGALMVPVRLLRSPQAIDCSTLYSAGTTAPYIVGIVVLSITTVARVVYRPLRCGCAAAAVVVGDRRGWRGEGAFCHVWCKVFFWAVGRLFSWRLSSSTERAGLRV